MAHGEADNGVDEQQHHALNSARWVCGAGTPPNAVPDDEPEPAAADAFDRGGRTLPKRGAPPPCRSALEGWAGAHRHLAVRPRARGGRRERPPDRWC